MRLIVALSFVVVGCSSPFGNYQEPEGAFDDDASVTEPESDAATAPDTRTAPPPPKTDSGSAPPPPPADTGISVAGCSVTLAGATGKEPSGMIPVCCAPGSDDKAASMEVFRMVNEHRAKYGRVALVYDDKLEAAIQGHCEHMKAHGFFSHDAPETAVRSFTTRASKCGASAGGENIAWGQTSPEEVMDSWKSSSGHNSNMLSSSWRRMGVGKAGTYWGQIFAP
jgi:uncharacterized protein YkwD